MICVIQFRQRGQHITIQAEMAHNCSTHGLMKGICQISLVNVRQIIFLMRRWDKKIPAKDLLLLKPRLFSIKVQTLQ